MIQMSQERMHSETLFLLGMWLWLAGSCICSPVSAVPPLENSCDTLSCAAPFAPTFPTRAAACLCSRCVTLMAEPCCLVQDPTKAAERGRSPVTLCPLWNTVCGAA